LTLTGVEYAFVFSFFPIELKKYAKEEIVGKDQNKFFNTSRGKHNYRVGTDDKI